MKTTKSKLQVGQRVLWYGEEPGQVVTVPAETFEEYMVKLDTGRIIFSYREDLLTSEDLESLSTDNPILD